MTRYALVLAGVFVLQLGASAVSGQTRTESKPVDRQKTETRTEADAKRQDVRPASRDAVRPHPGGLVQSDWIVGSRVHDRDGHELGKIKHIWIDPKDGRVKDVVVEVGGALGIGAVTRIVAWKDLTLSWKDQKPFVTVDRRVLQAARQTDGDVADRTPAASPKTDDAKTGAGRKADDKGKSGDADAKTETTPRRDTKIHPQK